MTRSEFVVGKVGGRSFSLSLLLQKETEETSQPHNLLIATSYKELHVEGMVK